MVALSQNQERLDRIVQGALEAFDAPGMAVAARRSTEEIASSAGLASTQGSLAFSLDHHLPMSCVMKPLVAMACLRLAESGALDLEADLAVYFPELTDRGSMTGVKPIHLLSHTAGYVEPVEPSARWFCTWESFSAFFPRRIRAFEPGTVWSYTHSGYAILGRLLERLEARPVQDILRDSILDPLGIRLGLLGERGEETLHAALHVKSSRSGRYEPMRPPRDTGFLRFSISDYTISTRDLLTLASFLAGGMGAANDPVRRRMLTSAISIPAPVSVDGAEQMPTAFGLGIGQYGSRYGVNGSFVGSTCALRFDAETAAAAAVSVNAWLPGARDRAISKLESFLGRARLTATPAEAPPIDLAAFEGHYQGMMMGSGRLVIERLATNDYRCVVQRLGAPNLEARMRTDRDGRLEIGEASQGFAIAAVNQPGQPPLVMVGASAYAIGAPA